MKTKGNQNNSSVVPITKELSGKIAETSQLHVNLGEKIITVTEDKVTIALMKYLKNLESRKDWQAPLGILATISITLLTTDFKDKLFLTKAAWQSIFVLGAIISFIWLIVTLVKIPKSMTIEGIVENIKNSTNPKNTSTK